MPTFHYDLSGVGSSLEFSPNGGRLVWNTDHFESTSDGSTLAQMRVPTTPLVGNDAASKDYVDGSSSGTYDIACFYPEEANANQPLLDFTFPRGATFADEFAGSVGKVNSNPLAPYIMSIEKNAVAIGSMTVSVAGVFTFTTIAGVAEVFVAGDVLSVRAPAVIDGGIVDVSFTLAGTKT